jgi:hypothetical protein
MLRIAQLVADHQGGHGGTGRRMGLKTPSPERGVPVRVRLPAPPLVTQINSGCSEMKWRPISEAELWDLMNAGSAAMSSREQRLWEAIRIEPEKWQQHPYGDGGGGFWAVGVLGRYVIWYNDIEDGFNTSRFKSYGSIDEYWCNQDKLEWTIRGILKSIDGDLSSTPQADLKS